MLDIQYGITIMGGREVSRPYRVWFFAEGEPVFILLAMRQVRSTGIAKRLFFMFLFQSPSIFPLNPKTDRLQRKTNIQKLDYLYYPDFG